MMVSSDHEFERGGIAHAATDGFYEIKGPPMHRVLLPFGPPYFPL